MTREQTFRSSFVTAFATYSGWLEVAETPKKKLPLSNFTSFAFELGKTQFQNYDLGGHALSGEQEFRLTIYFARPRNETSGIRDDHSDAVQLAQQFINDGIYTPPAVLPGDTFRIDLAEVVSIEPMRLIVGQTRYTVVMNGRYGFSAL